MKLSATTFKNNHTMNPQDVKQGEFFTLSGRKPAAMQVMECCPEVMTVKCSDGCITEKYSEFERITPTAGMPTYTTSHFEDRR
jgi:hypothetical protein